MCDTDLSERLLNDLTFNLKINSIISSPTVNNVSNYKIFVSDKQTQTDLADLETVDTELSVHESKDDDTISQTSVVKFNFEAIPPVSSPLRSPLRSPTSSNGVNKTILKKQNSSVTSSEMLTRSHSLSSPSKEFSPLLGGRQNGNKPRSDASRIARFRDRFANKKSSSIDACYSQSLALDIPEIILNSPEEEKDNQ